MSSADNAKNTGVNAEASEYSEPVKRYRAVVDEVFTAPNGVPV